MRRLAPRRLGPALDGLGREVRPPTTLARVQEAWPGVAGHPLREEAQPVAERRGVVTMSCCSAVWAQELELFSAGLLSRLNEALVAAGANPSLTSLRFVTAGGERVR